MLKSLIDAWMILHSIAERRSWQQDQIQPPELLNPEEPTFQIWHAKEFFIWCTRLACSLNVILITCSCSIPLPRISSWALVITTPSEPWKKSSIKLLGFVKLWSSDTATEAIRSASYLVLFPQKKMHISSAMSDWKKPFKLESNINHYKS